MISVFIHQTAGSLVVNSTMVRLLVCAPGDGRLKTQVWQTAACNWQTQKENLSEGQS